MWVLHTIPQGNAKVTWFEEEDVDPAAYSLSGHPELLGKKTNPLITAGATLAEFEIESKSQIVPGITTSQHHRANPSVSPTAPGLPDTYFVQMDRELPVC